MTELELELGLALPVPAPAPAVGGREELDLVNSAPGSCGRRSFGEARGGVKAGAGAGAATASFARGDDDDGNRRGDVDADGEMGNKRRKLVGWPPVKCLHRRRDGGGGGYVKVKMEGVAIGRKLDLTILGSYAELLDTLHRMFPSTNQVQRMMAVNVVVVTLTLLPTRMGRETGRWLETCHWRPSPSQ